MILLAQLDGKLPNIALMRLAAWAKARGDGVIYRRCDTVQRVQRHLGDDFDGVYASAIFTRTAPVVEAFEREWPEAVIGGTGSGSLVTLEDLGVRSLEQDYSIYPAYRHSLGFTQRGCRLKCEFCVVPQKEGAVRAERTIGEIWRGEPWPKNIVLLDNDFFGQAEWRERISEIRNGDFRVSFNQGINARCLTDEAAEAIASVKYADDDFTCRRLYTAWDSKGDERRLFSGLNALMKYGVKPDNIMVYMLIGYWAGETSEDWEYRRVRLRDFGCRPYPMPYVRTPELVAYQRWVVRRADLIVGWDEYWKDAKGRPEKVGSREDIPDLFGSRGDPGASTGSSGLRVLP